MSRRAGPACVGQGLQRYFPLFAVFWRGRDTVRDIYRLTARASRCRKTKLAKSFRLSARHNGESLNNQLRDATRREFPALLCVPHSGKHVES